MQEDEYKQLRRLIWLYATLIIFEGAVRKWGPPALSDPFLVSRAPIAGLTYALAIAKGVFPFNFPVIIFFVIGAITGFFAIVSGHGNPMVAGYGFQYNFFHFPIIWIIAKVMDKKDVMKLGAFLIILSIPNAAIMVLQKGSGLYHFINKGVGGSFGGQIDDGSGGIRPPGLFSFITGNNLFYPLVAAFLFAQVSEKRNLNWIFILAGFLGLFAAIAVCGSRTMVIACGITSVCFVFCMFKKGLLNAKLLGMIAIIPLVFIALYSTVPELQQGWEAYLKRWEHTTSEKYGGIEGGIFLRILAGFTNSFSYMQFAPFFGNGIGMGSNVGAVLLSGSMSFLLAEDEWSRIILEMGPIAGLLFILLRSGLAVHIGLRALKALYINKNALPLMIGTTSCVAILQGQIAPPTMLGFTVLSGGLTLAACQEPEGESDEYEDDELEEYEEESDFQQYQRNREQD